MLFLTLTGLETPISLMLLSSKGEEKIEGGKKGRKKISRPCNQTATSGWGNQCSSASSEITRQCL